MMRKTSLIFLGAIAGAGLTLLATQPHTMSVGSRAKANSSDTYQQLNLFADDVGYIRISQFSERTTGHLKADGNEESGSQSYVPPDEKDDRALKEALDLLRGTVTDAAFPPNPKAGVPN